jgi:hypothetical protein
MLYVLSQVEGISEFATVRVADVSLTYNNSSSSSNSGITSSNQWYYEVLLLTGGVAQIGWADENFKVLNFLL